MSDRDDQTPHAASADDVKAAIRDAIAQFETAREEKERPEKESAKQKETLTNRVSVAAISLTMLMSFLNFARTERDHASSASRQEASNAESASEVNWAHYQTTMAERANYEVADDALQRSIATLPDEDPRVSAAHVQHIEYQTHVRQIDQENRQIFFEVQDLERRAAVATRNADAIDRGIARYDLGARVLTLAIVLLSVTLLANRRYLFWIGIGVASLGAAIALQGYFVQG
jgi:hypothetical protein